MCTLRSKGKDASFMGWQKLELRCKFKDIREQEIVVELHGMIGQKRQYLLLFLVYGKRMRLKA